MLLPLIEAFTGKTLHINIKKRYVYFFSLLILYHIENNKDIKKIPIFLQVNANA